MQHEPLMAPPSLEARRWAHQHFNKAFPSLAQQQAPPQVNASAEVQRLLQPFLHAQAQQFQLLQAQQATAATGHQEEKKEEDNGKLNMSDQEVSTLLEMCGELLTADPILLPQWFHDCARKNTLDEYKQTILCKHTMNSNAYDDAEVPLTLTMLKMIVKRSWVGKDGDARSPSLLNAMEGLSPFFMAELDVDEVAQINSEEYALAEASHMTVADISKHKSKLRTTVPSSSDEFLQILKQYANLLAALFSSKCPLYQCVVLVIDALKAYSRASQNAMTLHSKAPILWILLLQLHHFSLGDMEVLTSFTTMHTDLCAKRATISYAEVPAALVQQADKRSHAPSNTPGDNPSSEPPTKRLRNNRNNWHPLLKEKLEIPMRKANNPTFTAITKYCNGADPSSVVPRDGRVCSPNMFFGHCQHSLKCTKQHKVASDEEA